MDERLRPYRVEIVNTLTNGWGDVLVRAANSADVRRALTDAGYDHSWRIVRANRMWEGAEELELLRLARRYLLTARASISYEAQPELCEAITGWVERFDAHVSPIRVGSTPPPEVQVAV